MTFLPAILVALCCLGMGVAVPAAAFQAAPANPAGQAGVMVATGTVQVMFTPDEDASRVIEQAIHTARYQILVQAFSFTHRRIAEALIAARHRGIDVRVLADRDQTDRIPTSKIANMAARGVPVFIDSKHASAHNKVMVIDAGKPDAVLVTGSFNFTQAAQYNNAENVLVMRNNPLLTERYQQNWYRHHQHSHAYQPKAAGPE